MIDYVKTAINGISAELKGLNNSTVNCTEMVNQSIEKVDKIRSDLTELQRYTYSTIDTSWLRVKENKDKLNVGDILYSGKQKLRIVDTDGSYIVLLDYCGVIIEPRKALYYCAEALPPSRYYFKMNFDLSYLSKGSYWSFQIDSEVPAGSLLLLNMNTSVLSEVYYNIYDKNYNYVAGGPINFTSSSVGSNLGTIDLYTVNGNVNSFDQVMNGENNWSTSTLRQFLNSDKPAGQWYQPQDKFSMCRYHQYNDGYLYGVDKEFVNSIGETYHDSFEFDTITKNYVKVKTYDKVYMPSAKQLFIQNEIDPVGSGTNSFEYCEILNNSKPLNFGDTYPDKIITTTTTPGKSYPTHERSLICVGFDGIVEKRNIQYFTCTPIMHI